MGKARDAQRILADKFHEKQPFGTLRRKGRENDIKKNPGYISCGNGKRRIKSDQDHEQ
jgi:hypothetical protein